MTDHITKTGIMHHFVLNAPRTKQVSALEYIERKYLEGFRDIVIAAPTGIGKSAIGATACFWSQDLGEIPGFDSGGYYLVTQKMLQDQLARDFLHYPMQNAISRCQSLKSASEYPCPKYGRCAFGLSRKVKCGCLFEGKCSYMQARAAWGTATLAATNYPYLFTEHHMVGKLLPRRVLVMDECHSLERQILQFVEISVTEEGLQKWAPMFKVVPKFSHVTQFADFILNDYLPEIKKKIDALVLWEATEDSPDDRKIAQEKLDLDNHYNRAVRGVQMIKNDPDNWVFSQGPDNKGRIEATAKPLDAAPFSQELVLEMGYVRIYMSAYPGSKPLFCRSLGLDPSTVAWLNLNSTFPVENRQIYLTTIGSMSRRNRDDTLPAFIRFAGKVLDCHDDTKGIIHCNSYELGLSIYRALRATAHGNRLLFPESSDARDPIFKRHQTSADPTVIISPSMTEGFDFAEDLARWQIIAKVPYPYLGDLQVAAKKENDPEWYDLQAVKTVVQACGRIVRSDTDVGHTYILDSDFIQLWERCSHMFPKWWSDALVWPKRKTRQ